MRRTNRTKEFRSRTKFTTRDVEDTSKEQHTHHCIVREHDHEEQNIRRGQQHTLMKSCHEELRTTWTMRTAHTSFFMRRREAQCLFVKKKITFEDIAPKIWLMR